MLFSVYIGVEGLGSAGSWGPLEEQHSEHQQGDAVAPLFSLHSHNDFVAILDLPEGEHQYKFFVDGQWVHDPSEVMLKALSLQILSSSWS